MSIDPLFDKTVASIESNNNPNAHSRYSSAKGLYQFTNSTAKQYGLTNPYDPDAATGAFHELTNDNRIALQNALGREPTPAELYLAHQQGANGAIKLLSNPNALAINTVGPDAVLHNGGNAGMTNADFAKLWTNKYDLKASQIAPTLGQGVQVASNDPNFVPQMPSAKPTEQASGTIQQTNNLKEVTDPDLLNQLNSNNLKEVTDPNILAQLNDTPGVVASAFSGAETSMNPLLAAGQYAAQGIHNLFRPTVPGVTDKSFSQIEQGIAGQNITNPQDAMQAHPIATMAGETMGNLAQGAIAGGAGGQVLGKVLGAAAPATTAATLDASKIAELTKVAEAEAKATIGNFNPAVPQLTQKLLQQKITAETASQAPGLLQQGINAVKQYGLPGVGATPGLYQAGKDALNGDFSGAAKGLGKAAIGAVGGKVASVAGVPATVGMAAGAISGDAYDSQFDNVQNNNDSSMYDPSKTNTDVSSVNSQPNVQSNTNQANTSLTVDNLNQYIPHLGQYAPILQNAAQRGPNALAATDFVLQQTSPEYNDALRNATGQISNWKSSNPLWNDAWKDDGDATSN